MVNHKVTKAPDKAPSKSRNFQRPDSSKLNGNTYYEWYTETIIGPRNHPLGKDNIWPNNEFRKPMTGEKMCLWKLANGKPCGYVFNERPNLVKHLKEKHHETHTPPLPTPAHNRSTAMPSAQTVLQYYKRMYEIHSAAYLAGERWDKPKSTAELDAEQCTPQPLDPEACPSQPDVPSVGKIIDIEKEKLKIVLEAVLKDCPCRGEGCTQAESCLVHETCDYWSLLKDEK